MSQIFLKLQSLIFSRTIQYSNTTRSLSSVWLHIILLIVHTLQHQHWAVCVIAYLPHLGSSALTVSQFLLGNRTTSIPLYKAAASIMEEKRCKNCCCWTFFLCIQLKVNVTWHDSSDSGLEIQPYSIAGRPKVVPWAIMVLSTNQT